MTDFNKKQGKVEGVEKNSASPKDQGGEPTTGFVQAPKVSQDRGGAGEGIPANRKTIR